MLLAPSIKILWIRLDLNKRATISGQAPGCGTWSGWSLRSKVIGTSNNFRYDSIVDSVLKTSHRISFSRRLEGRAGDPPKIIWTAPSSLGY
jgi:hypothetical protein